MLIKIILITIFTFLAVTLSYTIYVFAREDMKINKKIRNNENERKHLL